MTDSTTDAFTIRVYGIVINEHQEVLLSEEYHFDQFICKFPGGGLEFGEGTIDCLSREFLEETGQTITVGELYHTTDYYQPVFKRPNLQLICVYYKVRFKDKPTFMLNNHPFEHTKQHNGSVTFRWQPLATLSEQILTFNTDKQVVSLLALEFQQNSTDNQ